MTLQEIIDSILGGGGILLVAMTIVQILPIKINPWGYIAKKIGKAINGEVIEKVDKLGNDLKDLRNECDIREANTCRSQILRFGDEILHGTPHSKEHYDNILLVISSYENYCANHPEYLNNVAVATIKYIKDMYQKHLEDNSFL